MAIEERFTVLERMAEQRSFGKDFRQACMEALSALPGYDWCGVYLLEGEELVLDAFVGAPTEHDRIHVGVGVCGTAVATGENQVVEDVRAIENYLACSIETRSEIVVLIKKGERVLGQIDVDSHERGRFTGADEHFLKSLAALMAERW